MRVKVKGSICRGVTEKEGGLEKIFSISADFQNDSLSF